MKTLLGYCGLALVALVALFCASKAYADDPYYVECYVDAGPHAYEPNSCYAYVANGASTAHAYFMPSTPFLALLSSSISPPFSWSVAACNNDPQAPFAPCVVLIRNHIDKTVSFSIPAFNLTRSAVAGYDMGLIRIGPNSVVQPGR